MRATTTTAVLCTCAFMTTACAVIDAMDPPSVRAARRVLDGVEVPDEYRVVEGNGLDNNSPYRDYEHPKSSELPAVEPPPGFVEDDPEPFNWPDWEPVTVRVWTGEDQQLGVKCQVYLQTPPPSPDPNPLGPPLPSGTFRISASCSQDED